MDRPITVFWALVMGMALFLLGSAWTVSRRAFSDHRKAKGLVKGLREAAWKTVGRLFTMTVFALAVVVGLFLYATSLKLPNLPHTNPAQAPSINVVDKAKTPKPVFSPRWPHFDPHKTAPPFTRSNP